MSIIFPPCLAPSNAASSVSLRQEPPSHSGSFVDTAALSQTVAFPIVTEPNKSIVRVEEEDFSSDSEDDRPPTYFNIDLVKALNDLSITSSASPQYKTDESSDSPSLSPRAPYRRRQYRNWSNVASDFEAKSVKKARALSPGPCVRVHTPEEKTPRSSEELSNSSARRSVKRTRNGS